MRAFSPCWNSTHAYCTIYCIQTYSICTNGLHTHTAPAVLLPLTHWCLLDSQRVGVKTKPCNSIPVATVYLTPSLSLWQQSLTVNLSLSLEERSFYLSLYLALCLSPPSLLHLLQILCPSRGYFSQHSFHYLHEWMLWHTWMSWVQLFKYLCPFFCM